MQAFKRVSQWAICSSRLLMVTSIGKKKRLWSAVYTWEFRSSCPVHSRISCFRTLPWILWAFSQDYSWFGFTLARSPVLLISVFHSFPCGHLASWSGHRLRHPSPALQYWSLIPDSHLQPIHARVFKEWAIDGGMVCICLCKCSIVIIIIISFLSYFRNQIFFYKK